MAKIVSMICVSILSVLRLLHWSTYGTVHFLIVSLICISHCSFPDCFVDLHIKLFISWMFHWSRHHIGHFLNVSFIKISHCSFPDPFIDIRIILFISWLFHWSTYQVFLSLNCFDDIQSRHLQKGSHKEICVNNVTGRWEGQSGEQMTWQTDREMGGPEWRTNDLTNWQTDWEGQSKEQMAWQIDRQMRGTEWLTNSLRNWQTDGRDRVRSK